MENCPWNVYPRPQMRRKNWLNLNGMWEFSVTGRDTDRIRVPFCPESALSGVGQHLGEGAVLCYRRRVTLPRDYETGRVLLHIGAADQKLECYVNRKRLGSHAGGYEAMTFDITSALVPGENEITLLCQDDLNDKAFPYGKQVKPQNRGGMWYTPVSGIWQTVWLERVPERYMNKLSIENRGYSVTIDIGMDVPGTITVAGLGEYPLVGGRVTITPEKPHLWSPEDPYLYDFVAETEEDRVESYFAIRSLEVKQVGSYPRLCLNGKPYFFHGLLDQGYWPDGLFTPSDPSCYAQDILAIKALGFNTLRKHIKVEPEEFYYQCDRLGMIVWQDMVNNGDYRFFRDTALPTVGFQKLPERFLGQTEQAKSLFRLCAEATVNQLKSHPSIVLWTIFNEGWGQFDADNMYHWFRALDDTRFIDTTSGWFRGERSDVDSRHVYFRKVRVRGNGKKPLILSEFGGKTCPVPGHLFDPGKTYGYGGCKALEPLNARVAKLYREEILPAIDRGLCAAICTQLSDVEEEINGVLTYDRQVRKLTEETMVSLAEAMAEKMVALSQNLG